MKPLELRAVSSVTRPELSSLDEAQRAQLCVRERVWFNRERTAEEILGDEMEVRLVRISDEHGPAFDAWFNCYDEGPIYRVGTTDEVAKIIQDSLDCGDRTLGLALHRALTWQQLEKLRVSMFAEAVMSTDNRDAVMRAAGFLPHEVRANGVVVPYLKRTVFRFEALDSTQRSVAVWLAEHPELSLARFPLPGANWALRQWAGVDQRGVLFVPREDGRTPYEVVRAMTTEAELFAYTDALPLKVRAELLAALNFIPADFGGYLTANVLQKLCNDIDGSLGDWALKFARWLLSPPDVASPTSTFVRVERGAPLQFTSNETGSLRLPVYLALVRAGLSDDPAFDVLLPTSRWVSMSVRRECIDALPEARRESAILSAASDDPTGLLQLLEFYPYASLASHVLEHVHELNNPKRALDAMREIGGQHAAIGALVDAHLDALGPIASLRFGATVEWPPLESLTEVQCAQVVQLARRWYRVESSAAEMLTPREEGRLAYVRIDDARGPAFEAWLNEGGEGLIFRAGTTECVAHVGQYGVECEDRALLTALRAIFNPNI